jgi:hypothetical protein
MSTFTTPIDSQDKKREFEEYNKCKTGDPSRELMKYLEANDY